MKIETLKRYIEVCEFQGKTPTFKELKLHAMIEKKFLEKYNITFI